MEPYYGCELICFVHGDHFFLGGVPWGANKTDWSMLVLQYILKYVCLIILIHWDILGYVWSQYWDVSTYWDILGYQTWSNTVVPMYPNDFNLDPSPAWCCDPSNCWFPKMGVALNHPFFHRIFRCKTIQLLGYPLFQGKKEFSYGFLFAGTPSTSAVAMPEMLPVATGICSGPWCALRKPKSWLHFECEDLLVDLFTFKLLTQAYRRDIYIYIYIYIYLYTSLYEITEIWCPYNQF